MTAPTNLITLTISMRDSESGIEFSGPPGLKSLFVFGQNSDLIEVVACPGCWEAQTWRKIVDVTSWGEAGPPIRTIKFAITA